jgi:hypothetical protein
MYEHATSAAAAAPNSRGGVAQFHVNEKEIATAAAQLQPKTLIMVSGCWFIRSAHNVIIDGEESLVLAALTMRPRKGKMSERQRRCMHLRGAQQESRDFKRIYMYSKRPMQCSHSTKLKRISFRFISHRQWKHSVNIRYWMCFFFHFSAAPLAKILSALNWIKHRNFNFCLFTRAVNVRQPTRGKNPWVILSLKRDSIEWNKFMENLNPEKKWYVFSLMGVFNLLHLEKLLAWPQI